MSWFFNMCDSNMHGERIKIIGSALYVPLNHWDPLAEQHCVTSQNILIFMTFGIETFNTNKQVSFLG
jgi:hypothetical protein